MSKTSMGELVIHRRAPPVTREVPLS
jgi:hypothetical protein